MDDTSEKLYDAYLNAASRGETESPDVFLKRHGADDVNLLNTLRSIHAHVTQHSQESLSNRLQGASVRSENWVGEFELIRKLGEGGMGVVWLARQQSLARVVALKLLRAEAALSAGAGERFTREARAVAKLRHAGIVAIHAMGEAQGCIEGVSGRFPFIAMEFVEGKGLDEALKEARDSREFLPAARVIRWGIALARSLHAAHIEGIVHRDVKPSNIRLPSDADALPKLLDFGLARDVSSAQATISDAFVGSPYYAAPEQVARKGGEVDARTDVYALGCVLYEALTNSTTAHGNTLEHVLRSILVDEISSPRTINPRVSKDLATVVLKALEKEPSRRYQSAAAFADDLEAILELRAITARPATNWERTCRWLRRNKALSVGIATALAACIVLVGVLTYRSAAEARARRDEASRLIESAKAGIEQYNQLAAQATTAEEEFARIAPERGSRYFSDAEDTALAKIARRVEEVRQAREQVFETGQVDLARAERLGAAPRDVQRVRAQWYVTAALDAETRSDMKRRATFAELARAHDVDGEVEHALVGTGSLSIVTDPPGAEVFVYKRVMLEEREDRDEPRRVLVPLHGWGQRVLEDGDFALRVIREYTDVNVGDVIVRVAGYEVRGCVLVSASADDRLHRFDRLVRVDETKVEGSYEVAALLNTPLGTKRTLTFERRGVGNFDVTTDDVSRLGLMLKVPTELVREPHVPIEIWTDAGIEAKTTGNGIETRATAIPAPLVKAALVGLSPIEKLSIEPGSYVAIVRSNGRELVRIASTVQRKVPTEWRIALPVLGTTPDGFVLVRAGVGKRPLWFMEREVTCREYFEFLNDPVVKARIAASPTPVLYPRDGDTARGQRDAEGNFVLPEGWSWDWPVLFVSWHDAQAYATWRTEQARREGKAWSFRLPTLDEWVEAASPAFGDQYVFGSEFRPKWVSSCFARVRPDPESVMRFPIDESVLGVFDMAGSASEWSEDVYRPGYAYRRHMGGAWGSGVPQDFMVYGGNGLSPERLGGMIGFRLVLLMNDIALDNSQNAAKPSQ